MDVLERSEIVAVRAVTLIAAGSWQSASEWVGTYATVPRTPMARSAARRARRAGVTVRAPRPCR